MSVEEALSLGLLGPEDLYRLGGYSPFSAPRGYSLQGLTARPGVSLGPTFRFPGLARRSRLQRLPFGLAPYEEGLSLSPETPGFGIAGVAPPVGRQPRRVFDPNSVGAEGSANLAARLGLSQAHPEALAAAGRLPSARPSPRQRALPAPSEPGISAGQILSALQRLTGLARQGITPQELQSLGVTGPEIAAGAVTGPQATLEPAVRAGASPTELQSLGATGAEILSGTPTIVPDVSTMSLDELLANPDLLREAVGAGPREGASLLPLPIANRGAESSQALMPEAGQIFEPETGQPVAVPTFEQVFGVFGPANNVLGAVSNAAGAVRGVSAGDPVTAAKALYGVYSNSAPLLNQFAGTTLPTTRQVTQGFLRYLDSLTGPAATIGGTGVAAGAAFAPAATLGATAAELASLGATGAELAAPATASLGSILGGIAPVAGMALAGLLHGGQNTAFSGTPFDLIPAIGSMLGIGGIDVGAEGRKNKIRELKGIQKDFGYAFPIMASGLDLPARYEAAALSGDPAQLRQVALEAQQVIGQGPVISRASSIGAMPGWFDESNANAANVYMSALSNLQDMGALRRTLGKEQPYYEPFVGESGTYTPPPQYDVGGQPMPSGIIPPWTFRNALPVPGIDPQRLTEYERRFGPFFQDQVPLTGNPAATIQPDSVAALALMREATAGRAAQLAQSVGGQQTPPASPEEQASANSQPVGGEPVAAISAPPAVPSLEQGGTITQTGLYRLHRGEQVVPVHHEESETIQREDGKWVNVYGRNIKGTAGQPLPPTYPDEKDAYDSLQEAEAAARRRSQEEGVRPQSPGELPGGQSQSAEPWYVDLKEGRPSQEKPKGEDRTSIRRLAFTMADVQQALEEGDLPLMVPRATLTMPPSMQFNLLRRAQRRQATATKEPAFAEAMDRGERAAPDFTFGEEHGLSIRDDEQAPSRLNDTGTIVPAIPPRHTVPMPGMAPHQRYLAPASQAV